MNAIGAQLRDPINSGLTRWRLAVINEEMDAAAELGRNPVNTRFHLSSLEMSRLTRDGTAELVSRDQILRHEQRGQENIHFSCSADLVQDWQPYYPVDPYSCYMCDHTLLLIATICRDSNQNKNKGHNEPGYSSIFYIGGLGSDGC